LAFLVDGISKQLKRDSWGKDPHVHKLCAAVQT
jgi:hypothetical protein